MSIKKKIILVSVLITVITSVFTILQIRKAVIHTEELKIQEMVEVVYNKIAFMDSEVQKGHISKEFAQKIIIKEMPLFNYQSGRNYVWINDFNNVMLYNPKRRVGSNCTYVTGPDGKQFYKDITQMAIDGSKDVYTYRVTRILAGEPTVNVTKISTAKAYRNWGWVIATGVYLDDVDNIVKRAVLLISIVNLLIFFFIIITINYIFTNSTLKALKSFPFPAWYKDVDGKYIAVNDSFLDFTKLSLDKVLNKKVSDFLDKDFSKGIRIEDLEIIKKRITFYGEKKVLLNNETKYVQCFKIPILSMSDKVIGLAGCFIDVTQQKEFDNIKSEFISVVSHELRTPLTSIIGSLGLILNVFANDIPPKVNELLAIADKNSKRLKLLIDNILDVTKIESDKMIFNFESVDINEAVNEIVEEMQAYGENFRVNLNKKNDFSNSKVRVDKTKLNQILANICSNAIKFSKEEANVDIEIDYHNDNNIKVCVTNYNAPISERYKDMIFDKFTQMDSSDKKSNYGSGLGLNIAKQLVEKMNGEIWFTSDERETKFYISFKLVE